MSDSAIQSEEKAAEREENGRWITPPKSPGRPKGSRNKFAEAFLSDFLTDWEANGSAAIVAMREESPKDYVKIGAMILPKQVEVTVNEIEQLADDELLKRIDAIDARINAVAAGKASAESGVGAPAENTEAAVLQTLH